MIDRNILITNAVTELLGVFKKLTTEIEQINWMHWIYRLIALIIDSVITGIVGYIILLAYSTAFLHIHNSLRIHLPIRTLVGWCISTTVHLRHNPCSLQRNP